ncbi:aconitase X swivel domain-containing protein [Thermodesulfobacteriota bacterium]
MILKGTVINEGKVEGEAIVSKLPFSFLGDFEVSTGKIMPKGHDCEGQSIKGKIFVFPTGKGSTAGPNVAFIGKQQGTTPAGMILVEAEPVIAMVGIMNDIPMVHRLDKNPLQEIQTGDYVVLDAYTGKVVVTKR